MSEKVRMHCRFTGRVEGMVLKSMMDIEFPIELDSAALLGSVTGSVNEALGKEIDKNMSGTMCRQFQTELKKVIEDRAQAIAEQWLRSRGIANPVVELRMKDPNWRETAKKMVIGIDPAAGVDGTSTMRAIIDTASTVVIPKDLSDLEHLSPEFLKAVLTGEPMPKAPEPETHIEVGEDDVRFS